MEGGEPTFETFGTFFGVSARAVVEKILPGPVKLLEIEQQSGMRAHRSRK
jgi:hypothetical protein